MMNAPWVGVVHILYPVSAAFLHRSTAFPHRVLCWVFVSMYGKNSGEILAAPYVQYHFANVFSISISMDRIEMILPCLSDAPGFCIAVSKCSAVSVALFVYNSWLSLVIFVNPNDESVTIPTTISSKPWKRKWCIWFVICITLCTCVWKCILRWWILWWGANFFFLLIKLSQIKVRIQLYSQKRKKANFELLFCLH